MISRLDEKREFFLREATWWQLKAAATHELIETERKCNPGRPGFPWGTEAFLQRLSAKRSKMARQFLFAAINPDDCHHFEDYNT